MCQLCNGAGLVKATEIAVASGRTWACNTNGAIHGAPGLPPKMARCNRPKNVKRVIHPEWGNTREGMADCPLCVRAVITPTETDDFGFAAPFEVAPW